MKSIILVVAIVAGIFLPVLGNYSFLIRPAIMIMLFLSFLKIKVNWSLFPGNLFVILFANIVIGIGSWLISYYLWPELAACVFVTAITPTAVAAPVVIGMLGRNVEYTIGGVLLSNCIIAAVISLCLPMVVPDSGTVNVLIIMQSILGTIAVPLALALIMQRFSTVHSHLLKGVRINFYLWAMCIILACARASKFIREQDVELSTLVAIALISLILCIGNFLCGALFGGKKYRREASQILGQKNTMFTTWIALTFISPLAALGPIFYLVYHNIYNSIQIALYHRKSVK